MQEEQSSIDIVHCGTPAYMVERLCNYHCWSGCSTFQCGPSDLHEVLAGLPAQVVHLHGADFLGNTSAALDATVAQARAKGSKLVFSAFEVAPAPTALNQDGLRFLQQFNHVFLGSPAFLPSGRTLPSQSWLGVGVDLDDDPPTIPHEGPQGELILVSIDWPGSGVSAQVSAAISALDPGLGPIAHRQLQASAIQNHDELAQALTGAHILVERLDGLGFGFAALEALSRGMTVISGNPPDQRDAAPALQYSPILHTTESTLAKRLEALARERRSMRDLHKRSLQYLSDYHRFDLAAALMLKKYEELRAE